MNHEGEDPSGDPYDGRPKLEPPTDGREGLRSARIVGRAMRTRAETLPRWTARRSQLPDGRMPEDRDHAVTTSTIGRGRTMLTLQEKPTAPVEQGPCHMRLDACQSRHGQRNCEAFRLSTEVEEDQ